MKNFAWPVVGLGYLLLVLENQDISARFQPLFPVLLAVFSGAILWACRATWENPVVHSDSPKFGKIKRLALSGLFALAVQFLLGSLMRTQHSGLACPNFPACIDGFFPSPLTYEAALAFTHRWWGVLMVGVFAHLTLVTPKIAPALTPVARQLLPLAVVQIILGVGTVMSGMTPHLRATHAAVGYGLWGLLFFISVRAGAFQKATAKTS